MEIDKRSLIQYYINTVKEYAPIFGQDPNIIKINCSECTHECKLRMQLEQSKEDIPPEYPPAVIYY